MWICPTKDALLCFVVHFIKSSKRISRTLDTFPLDDESSHDANSCKLSLNNIMHRYGLFPTKLVTLISDGVAVNGKTAKIMDCDFQRCAAHLLSLLVEDICSIGHLFEVYQNCSGIQRVFSKSAIENHFLRTRGVVITADHIVREVDRHRGLCWH